MKLKKFSKALCIALALIFVLNPEYASAKEIGSTTSAINKENSKGIAAGAKETAYVYDEPSTDGKILNIVLQNQVIRVIEEVDGFYKIRYNNTFAYVEKDNFLQGDELVRYILEQPEWFTRMVNVAATSTPLFDWLSSEKIDTALYGESFQLKAIQGDFYLVILNDVNDEDANDCQFARIYKEDCKIKYQISVTSFETDFAVTTEQMDLIEFACQFVGNSYVWGGNDPNTGADCSGFVQYVYEQFGISLPRCSYQQAEVGEDVPFEELQPGDLVFYYRGDRIGHVALYIGDGKVVHARGTAYGICVTNYDYTEPAWAKRVL